MKYSQMRLIQIVFMLTILLNTKLIAKNNDYNNYDDTNNSLSSSSSRSSGNGDEYEEYADDEVDDTNDYNLEENYYQHYNCPTQCECSHNTTKVSSHTLDYDSEPNLSIKVDCSNKSLNSMQNLFDDDFPIEQITKLNLSSNNLKSLKSVEFEYMTSVEILDLSSNPLFDSITITQLKYFTSLKSIILNNLYLNCDCNLKKVLNFLSKNNIKLVVDHTKCSEDHGLQVSLALDEFPSCDTQSMTNSATRELIKIEPSVDQLIFEGDPLKLKCKINQKQMLTIGKYKILKLIWFINEKRAFSESISEENEISLTSVNRLDHDGTWKCVLYDDKRILTQSQINLKIIENTNKIYCPQVEIKTYKGVFRLPKIEINKNITLKCVVNQHERVSFECLSNGKWSSSYLKNIEPCEFESNLTRNLYNLSIRKSKIHEFIKIIQEIDEYKFNINDFSLLLSKMSQSSSDIDQEQFKILSEFIFNNLNDELFHESSNFHVDLTKLVNKFYEFIKKFVFDRDFNVSTHRINILNDKILSISDIKLLSNLRSNESFRLVSTNLVSIQVKSLQNASFEVDFNLNETILGNLRLVYSKSNETWFTLSKLRQITNSSKIRVKLSEENFTFLGSNETDLIISFALAKVSPLKTKLFNVKEIVYELKLDFNMFKYKSIYYSCILVIPLLWSTVIIFLWKSKEVLMPRKQRHCLVNTWLSYLFLHFFEVFGLKQSQTTTTCFLFAFLIHFLTLSTCFWYNLYFYEFFKKLSQCRKNNDALMKQQQQQQSIIQQSLKKSPPSDKKMISISRPVISSDDDDGDNDSFSDTDSNLNDESYVLKPIAHLYMISLGVPLILCSIGLACARSNYIRLSVDEYECEYCYPSQFEAIILTLILPLSVLLVLKLVFILLTIYTTKRIIKSLRKDEEALNCEKGEQTPDGLSTCTSIVDSQFKPKYQLTMAFLGFFLFLCKSSCVFYLNSDSSQVFEDDFSHVYSILAILYSISNFSFYILSRDDIHFEVLYRLYNKLRFRSNRLPPKCELYSSQSTSNEYEVPSDAALGEICSDPKEYDKLINEIKREETPTSSITNETTAQAHTEHIHFIDTPTSLDEKNENESSTKSNTCSRQKSHHQRNPSVLSGQLNETEYMFINSMSNAQNNESQLNCTTKTNNSTIYTLTKKPLYVYVDHTYEEKVSKKQQDSDKMIFSTHSPTQSTQSYTDQQSQVSTDTSNEQKNYLHEIDLLIQKLSPWTQRLKTTSQIEIKQETSV